MHSAAAWLARRNVSPNAISVAGMLFATAAGVLLTFTALLESGGPQTNRHPSPSETWTRIAGAALWLLAAAGVQLRLLCNLLDGMVAVEHQRSSPVGELYNEIPDRVSDTAVLVGLGLAAGGSPLLGLAAALAAMFTAYVRSACAAAGAGQDFRGPMAKQHRMFIVTVTAVACALLPDAWRTIPLPGGVSWIGGLLTLPMTALAIITVGSIVTAVNRLAAAAGRLRNKV